MHIFILRFNKRSRLCAATAVLFVFSLVAGNASVTLADFTAVGDVTGFDQDTNRGGGMTLDADVVVGVNDLGGILGDGEQVLGGVNPLVSTSLIIGDQIDGIGAVTLNDSASRWDITADLTIGNEGQGILTIGTSATVDVTGNTILGLADIGLGILDINGTVFPGARLRTTELTVGDAGVGIIEISARGSLVSEVSTVGAMSDSGDGTVTLTDTGTRWSVRESLVVGGLAGLSQGKVLIANGALLQVQPEAGTTGLGLLTINPRGRVELAGGTLRIRPQVGNPIANNGLILGDGFIDGGINIGVSGELRNAAGLANAREYLLVSEAVTNAGTIESIGGEMEFQQRVTSTGDIVGRDAILRFRGSEAGTGPSPDLAVNGGTLQLGGDTTVYGDVNVDVGGGASLNIFGGGAVVFVDGLSFGPAPLSGLAASTSPEAATTLASFSVTLGESPALEIGGLLDLGTGLTLDVIYDGLQPSMENDVLTVLTAAGGISITGMFTNDNDKLIADGRVWDIGYLANEVFITALGVAQDLTGDFDFDRDVDGNDFLTWQRGSADAAGLADWESNFGRSGPGPLSAVTAVPEPSTMALVLLSLACCPRRRSRV